MKIKGFQKVTLIDYPDTIACTIFLFGCNFRCGFCHNPELIFEDEGKEFSEAEILNYLEKRKKYLEGVCITGGEPFVSLEFGFLQKIKELGYKIKIDTNGSFPERLEKAIAEGLVDFVAMDIKASKENYQKVMNAGVNLENIEKSIKLIARLDNYEFRTTIVEGMHDAEEIEKMGKWLNEIVGRKPKKFCLQGFQNQGKLLDEAFRMKKNTSEEFLNKLKEVAENYFEEVEVRV